MPEITEVFYPKGRAKWRFRLETHRRFKLEIRVPRFLKSTGVAACLNDDEMGEECLCFGWVSEAGDANRRAESEKRLAYLIKMTEQGKRYGTEPMTAFD